MTMLSCLCGAWFSDLTHVNCPTCGKQFHGAENATQRLLSSHTREKTDDLEVTTSDELKLLGAIATMAMAVPIVLIVFLFATSRARDVRCSSQAERCRMTADLPAKAGGGGDVSVHRGCQCNQRYTAFFAQ